MSLSLLRLIEPTRQGIVLETHRGTRIKNEIAPIPVAEQVRAHDRLLAAHRMGWIPRKPATGIYNCIGHIWACRRTAVYDTLEDVLRTIYADDGYRVVDWPRETLCPGDLATYWFSARSRTGFCHVGTVVEIRAGQGNVSAPWVLSKWNDYSGEVLHHFGEHPLPRGVEVEFWTDRP